MRKSFLAVAVLSLVLFLFPFAGPRGAAADRTLVYSHFANAGPLNPHLYSPNQMYAQELLYDGLVQLADDNRIEPALAETWDISPDGLVYTFHLRPGLKFSDGTPLDAAAVDLNFQSILKNRARHAWLELANRIVSHRALNDRDFQLVLDQPYQPVLADLALPRPFRILAPSAFPPSGNTRDGIARPIGSGPFLLQESNLGVQDVFVRNPHYWGEKPRLERVVVKIIPDPVARAIAFQTGEIDLIYGEGQIPFYQYDVFAKDPRYVAAASKPMGGLAVAINTNRAPTDDLRVRLALQHLVDKDALAAGVFLGSQVKADFLFNPDLPECQTYLTPYRYDPAEAERLLDAAGWILNPVSKIRFRDGQPLSANLCYVGNNATHKAIAEILQANAAAVGFGLTLLGEEEDSFLRRQRSGDFQLILNPTWGPPFEPHAVLASMRAPAHADYEAQRGLADKAEIDADITRALQTGDSGERDALYRKILSALHREAVYLPLHYDSLLAVYRKGEIGNFRFGPGKTHYPFATIEKDPDDASLQR